MTNDQGHLFMKKYNLIFRLVFLVITTILFSYLLFNGFVFYWPLLVFLTLILQIIWILSVQNILNRQIAQFFRSVRNSDHGFVFTFNSENQSIRDIHAEMERINVLVRDLKRDLVTQERYYQVLLERVSSGIMTIDSQGFIKLANQAAHRILNCSVLSPLDHIERIDIRLFNHLKNKQPKERIVLSKSDTKGSKDISIITQRLTVRDEALLLVILQDIRTELDEKELDSWIRLIRVQAHEIRNSMAPIAAITESLISTSKNDTIKEGVNIILDRSRHLTKFVDSYRQLTHLPDPEKSRINISELIDRVRILLSDQPNFKDVKFKQVSGDASIYCNADPNQLTQVLINLLRNAYEALQSQASPELSIKLEQNKGTITIRIIDNGPGIPSDQLEEIFIPFFTTKPTGTGVGLSLSKQIIRKHGGELTVQSKQEKGSTFTIEL